MIETVTVTNHLGAVKEFPLMAAHQTGFGIYNITGLGSGPADVSITDLASTDGGLFSSSRLKTRNIVLYFYLLGDDVEKLRHELYRYFPSKKQVKLTLQETSRSAYIMGYVEKVEPVIFSERESIQISIICPDPKFYSSDPDSETYFYDFHPLFEFPFSNESLVNGITEISEMILELNKNIYYEGDTEIGMEITMDALGPVVNPKIANSITGEYIGVDSTKLQVLIGSNIEDGDKIKIVTYTGQKSIHLIRGETDYNILNCLIANSTWLQLIGGDNPFTVSADSGALNLQVAITSKVTYGGM